MMLDREEKLENKHDKDFGLGKQWKTVMGSCRYDTI